MNTSSQSSPGIAALGPFDLGSDGEGRDLITVRAGGSEQRLAGLPAEAADHYFAMAGKEACGLAKVPTPAASVEVSI